MEPIPFRPTARATRVARGARAHRALRVGIALLSATLVPALFLCGRAADPATASFVVLGLWIVGWLALGVALLLFRCPRCGRPFHRDGTVLSAFNDRCLHCGMALRPDAGGR